MALKISTHTLSNNLQIIKVPMPGIYSATVMTMVKAGARNETVHNNGISHFLEHMVFKGTKKYKTAFDITSAIDSVGGEINAGTSKEYTQFYVKTAVEYIDLSLDIVSQMVFYPSISATELEIEKGVILEEIRMYEDQPQNKVIRNFGKLIFQGSSLAMDALGSFETVSAIKREDFLDYRDYLYDPSRMVLVVAGGLDRVKNLDKKIETYFQVNSKNTQIAAVDASFNQGKACFDLVEKKTEQCHLVYGFRSFGRTSPYYNGLMIISAILGNNMSSRLFMEIREKRGLAYYVSSYNQNYHETGAFIIRAGTKPESASEVVKICQTEIEKLKTKKVGNQELEKAKKYLKGNLLLEFEDSLNVAEYYGEELLLDKKVSSIEKIMAQVDKVSSQDILDLAKILFSQDRENLAAIGPGVEKLAW